MLKLLTLGDKVLIALLAVAVIGSYFAVRAYTQRGTTVLIQVDGYTTHKTSLLESHVINVVGFRGRLTVETLNGKVSVTHAECPNHICVRTGWRSGAGEVIVCVPNKTVVRILADDAGGVRAVTG